MSNPYEQARREAKVRQLVAVITVDAVADGEDWLSPAFVQKLEQAGRDFWMMAAIKARCHEPSRETCAQTVDFFRQASAKVVRPNQPAAEA